MLGFTLFFAFYKSYGKNDEISSLLFTKHYFGDIIYFVKFYRFMNMKG